MDEMLVELFVPHPSSESFEGNLPGRFRVVIKDVEYGTNKMPGVIGLYSGRYTIVFHPSE
jgi:hypothetical protein